MLSGLPLFNVLRFGLFSLFLSCFFLLTDFLTEPRTSFYPVSPSWLWNWSFFWPHNKFFVIVFIHIFPFYIFFLMGNSVYSFAHFGNWLWEAQTGQVYYCLWLSSACPYSVGTGQSCQFPLMILTCLVCITSKSEKLTCSGCSVLYWEN